MASEDLNCSIHFWGVQLKRDLKVIKRLLTRRLVVQLPIDENRSSYRPLIFIRKSIWRPRQRVFPERWGTKYLSNTLLEDLAEQPELFKSYVSFAISKTKAFKFYRPKKS